MVHRGPWRESIARCDNADSAKIWEVWLIATAHDVSLPWINVQFNPPWINFAPTIRSIRCIRCIRCSRFIIIVAYKFHWQTFGPTRRCGQETRGGRLKPPLFDQFTRLRKRVIMGPGNCSWIVIGTRPVDIGSVMRQCKVVHLVPSASDITSLVSTHILKWLERRRRPLRKCEL